MAVPRPGPAPMGDRAECGPECRNRAERISSRGWAGEWPSPRPKPTEGRTWGGRGRQWPYPARGADRETGTAQPSPACKWLSRNLAKGGPANG